jgi:hypothetical protein
MFAFPVELSRSNLYSPIQAINAFGDLLLPFAGLFLSWLAIILVLLRRRSDAITSALVVFLFVLVFLFFWVFHSSSLGARGEGLVTVTRALHISATGRLDLGRFPVQNDEFFALSLLTAALNDVTGLGSLDASGAFMLMVTLLLGLTLLLFFKRSSSISYTLSGLLVMVWVNADILFPREFELYAGVVAFPLFVLIWAMELSHKPSMRNLFAELLLGSALVFFYPLDGPLLITSFLVTGILSRTRRSVVLALNFLLVYFLWEMYSLGNLGTVGAYAVYYLQNIRALGSFYLRSVTTSNFGGSIPLWMNLIQYFWIGCVAVGLLLSFAGVATARHERKYMVSFGFLVSSLLVGGTLLPADPTAWTRLIPYFVLLVIPLSTNILTRVTHIESAKRNAMLLIIILGLSFPTFLTTNRLASEINYFPTDLSASAYVATNDETGTVYYSFGALALNFYAPYTPLAGLPDLASVGSSSEFYRILSNTLHSFQSNQNVLAVISDRQNLASVGLNMTWNAVLLAASNYGSTVYSNGFVYVLYPR